jgi:hypothetical protein
MRDDYDPTTCVVEYVIDPAQIDVFERFARRWMELVNASPQTSSTVLCSGRIPCSSRPIR